MELPRVPPVLWGWNSDEKPAAADPTAHRNDAVNYSGGGQNDGPWMRDVLRAPEPIYAISKWDLHSHFTPPPFYTTGNQRMEPMASTSTRIDTFASEEGSTTSESAWISDYSGDVPRLEDGHPLLSIKSDVVRVGLLNFRDSKQRQHPGAQVTTTKESSTAAKATQATPLQRKRLRTSGAGDDEPRESEDDDDFPAKRARTSKRTYGQNPSFACPFAKKDPLKYRCCYTYVMKRIRDVKQHLSRFHQLPIYCPLCMDTFDTEDERDVHIRAASCPVQPTISYEGVTRAQKVLLGQRVSSKMTLSDQWFTIFDILFPGHSPRPKSAYMNVELTVELEGFQDLMYAEGSKIISTAITSSGLQISNVEDREGDTLALLELAIEDGMQQIAQRWSTSLPRTRSESSPSQETTADELMSPNTARDTGGLDPSRSASSDTLLEITSGQLTTQGATVGDDEDGQARPQISNQSWDEWNSETYQLGNPAQSNMLSQDLSNIRVSQQHREPASDHDIGNGSDIWEMINQEEWNNYHVAIPDTSRLREDDFTPLSTRCPQMWTIKVGSRWNHNSFRTWTLSSRPWSWAIIGSPKRKRNGRYPFYFANLSSPSKKRSTFCSAKRSKTKTERPKW
ncbi:hypothetical protein V8E51_012121 [Hyaloscypha variabilis]